MKKTTLFKQVLSVLLCLVMVAATFSACSGGTASDADTGSEVSSQPSQDQPSDPESGEKGPLYIEGSEGVTLTYWIPISSLQAQNFSTMAEHPYFVWLKEQTGVNVEFVHPSEEQMDQQLNLMLASGKFYDMLFNAWYPGGPQAALDEGCFIDLTPYLDEYMPDYKAALDCGDGSISDWEWGDEKELYKPAVQPAFRKSCTSFDGSLWCVTQIWADAYLPDCGPIIRKDWLDEAGLEVPETLEELEVVLEAFKARGEDVVPMSLNVTGINFYTGAIISAFDIYDGFTLTPDKTTVQPHCYVQDAFKDYLPLINDWYGKGYIDPDFMNRDDESLMAMLLDDRLGIYWDQWSEPEYWESLYTGDQDFDIVAMPLPRIDKDQQLNWLYSYDSSPTCYTCITTSCEHPEIAAAWLNVGYTREGILRHTYGVEGETYEMRDGKPYYLESIYNGELGESDYINACMLYSSGTSYNSARSAMLWSSYDSDTTLSPRVRAQLVWAQNAAPNYNWTYTIFEGDGWGKYESKINDARTYADPLVLKFIIGEESLDRFEEFRSTSKELGLDEAQAMAQAARDNMLQGN